MSDSHVVMIGLDGMPLEIFEILFERGVMPFLKNMWHRLIRGRLDVLIPYTLPSWTTISTGVNPGKHGVFDFLEVDSKGNLRVVTKDRLEYPLVNEIVSFTGKKSISINVPMNYPPFVRSNNVVVSSWAATKNPKAWPEDETRVIKKFMPEEFPKPVTLDSYIEALADILESRISMIEYYYVDKKWDLFYSVIPEPDWFFHKAFGDYIRYNKKARKGDKIFSLLDKLIRIIYENRPDNTLIELCSDHGFMKTKKILNGNIMLKKLGFLSEQKNVSPKSKLALWIARTLPDRLRIALKQNPFFSHLLKSRFKEITFMGSSIDYASSTAFMLSSYTLYINSRNKSSEVISSIKRAFYRYNYMFEILEEGKRYFEGPYVDRTPDLIIVPRDGYHVTTTLAHSDIVEEAEMNVHSSKGFFALMGDPIDKGDLINKPVKSTSLVPTALSHLNIPLDPYIDGEPLLNTTVSLKRNYRIISLIAKRITTK